MRGYQVYGFAIPTVNVPKPSVAGNRRSAGWNRHRLIIAHRCYGQPHKKEEEAPERCDGLGCSDLALSVPFRARASHIMQLRLVSVEHSSPKLSYDFRNFAEHGLAPIFSLVFDIGQ